MGTGDVVGQSAKRRGGGRAGLVSAVCRVPTARVVRLPLRPAPSPPRSGAASKGASDSERPDDDGASGSERPADDGASDSERPAHMIIAGFTRIRLAQGV